MKYKHVVCQGVFALGTACGLCEKCLEQKAEYQARKDVQETLDGTAALKAIIARLTAEVAEARDDASALLAQLAAAEKHMARTDAELTAANQRVAASVEAVARANADRDALVAAAFPKSTLESIARKMLDVDVLEDWTFRDAMGCVEEDDAKLLGVTFANGKGYNGHSDLRGDERDDAAVEIISRALAHALTPAHATAALRAIAGGRNE